MELSKKQIKHLKSLAHSLSPAVMVGDAGVTEKVVAALKEYLGAHELVKVRIAAEDRDQFAELVQNISKQIDDMHLVSTIGRMAIFYKGFLPNQVSKNPSIKLP